jgi:hypothetical protein
MNEQENRGITEKSAVQAAREIRKTWGWLYAHINSSSGVPPHLRTEADALLLADFIQRRAEGGK